jgi:hypothetical protein
MYHFREKSALLFTIVLYLQLLLFDVNGNSY